MAKKDQAYYRDLLGQYINGSISKEGRFELEKLALDDPFLFEALEGYNIGSDDKKTAINRLKEKTQQTPKSNTTRRIPLMNYGIAASLVLILGAGLWFFNQTNSATEQIAYQTNASDGKIMPSSQVMEEEGITLSNDEIAEQEKTNNDSEDVENKSNNQYDSPKSRISQVEVVETSSAATDFQANAQPQPQATEEESTITLKRNESTVAIIAETKIEELDEENGSTAGAGQAAAAKSQPINESRSKARIMEQTKEEALEESIDQSSEFTSDVAERKLQLDKDQYLLAQDQSTLVAPEGGITTLKNLISTTTEKLKSLNQSSNEDIIISFSLSKEGRPIEFDIESGSNQACINMIISTLKHGVDWITEPPNTEAKVQLNLSCN